MEADLLEMDRKATMTKGGSIMILWKLLVFPDFGVNFENSSDFSNCSKWSSDGTLMETTSLGLKTSEEDLKQITEAR